MKKKLVISIVSIMSFILLLSGILIFNNKEVKNSSVDKEIKSENQEDTTWQEDYIYKRDKKNKILILSLYKGNSTNIVIPAKAVIDGVEYTTMPLGGFSSSLYEGKTISSLTIEDGVMFPTHLMETFDNIFDKIKIGKVDLSMLDSLLSGYGGGASHYAFRANTEIDLTDFDNTGMEKLGLFGSSTALRSNIFAPKLILGEKVILKKEFNNATTYLIPQNNTGYWLREGTNEVYTPQELADIYDGSTMAGTYTQYNGNIISFYPNGTDGKIYRFVNNDSTSLINNPYSRYGYNFEGWNTESDGSGTTYNSSTTIPNENIDLYAIWSIDSNISESDTKTISINTHLNEEDSIYYSENDMLQRYQLKLTKDDKPYTDDIVIDYSRDEQTLKSVNGVYSFSFTKSYTNENGVVLTLPSGVKYEFIPYNTNLSDYASLSEKIVGTLDDNKTYDVETSVPKFDLKFYYLTSDVYGNKDFNLKINIHSNYIKGDDISAPITYDGDRSGTVNIVRTNVSDSYIYLTVSDGDILTFHGFPTQMYWGDNGNQVDIGRVTYAPFMQDYSGPLSLDRNPTNYLYGNIIERLGAIVLQKAVGNYGLVEDKKFKFKITANYILVDKPLTGEYPYIIIDSLTQSEIKSGKVTFDENGVAYVYLKPGERILIGAAPFGYDNNYNGVKSERLLYDTDGIIPFDIHWSVEEIEDMDKYNINYLYKNNILPNTLNIVTNTRNRCSLKLKKDYIIDSSKLTYLNFKKYLPENTQLSIEHQAMSYKYSKLLADNKELEKFINENLDEKALNNIVDSISNPNIAQLHKIIETNQVDAASHTLYENYKANAIENDISYIHDEMEYFKSLYYATIGRYLFSNGYEENLSVDTKYEIYEEYFSENIAFNNSFLYQMLSSQTSFKLTLKDNTNYSNYNDINIPNLISKVVNEDESVTYYFKIQGNLIIDGDVVGTEYQLDINTLCGIEYEFDEVENSKFEHEYVNAKGILKSSDNDESNVASIINKVFNSGTLTLNKKIKGEVKKDEEFTFEISLDLDEDSQNEFKYTGSKEGIIEFVDGKASITLKGGESITIENLPLGTEYKVVENTKGYKVEKENDTGKVEKNTKVTFTNSKEVKNITEIVNTLDGVGKYIAVALVSVIGIITTLYLRKNNLER